MGFLHKIWDETLAGPAPDSGLGKLRKYNSFPASRTTGLVSPEALSVTRSITILRKSNPVSAPESPVESSFLGTSPSSGDFGNFTRLKKSTEGAERAQPRTPTVYDWIVISALDR